MTVTNDRRIPYSVKLLYSAFVAIVVPLYWVTYTPWNFLYFCDIALLVTAAAIWMESRRPAMSRRWRRGDNRRNQLHAE